MAQQYVLSTDSFATITETSGTIQNVGIEAVELVSGTNAVAGEGITLRPDERIAFDGAISARRLGDNDAVINVVDFSLAGKGGVNHVYIPKGSVTFANLPTTLTEDMLGWTYNVSDAFTTDSQFVEGAGVSYPAGQNVVVVEASTGVYKYDCFGGAYILPVATDTVLGGVKSSSADGKVSVGNDGVMSINLPTASITVKGGIKIGDSFDVSSDTLLLNVGNTTVVGGVKSSATDGDVSINNDGTMTQNLIGYRKPSTAYTAGQIAYHASLPTGYYLECTTAGTTGSGALTISGTITPNVTIVTDGTVTWLVRSVKSAVQFNTVNRYTSSGSFTAPVTGVYNITLRGGGGGGSGAGAYSSNGFYSGSGGGQGGTIFFFAKLIAGTSYNFVIGAGGAGGASGKNNETGVIGHGGVGGTGGNSYITIDGITYTAYGGYGGSTSIVSAGLSGGLGGSAGISPASPGYTEQGAAGVAGFYDSTNQTLIGGTGGGFGGSPKYNVTGQLGGGGAGGTAYPSPQAFGAGSAGGDGYIIFQYCSN